MRTYRTLVATLFLACVATLLSAQTPTVVPKKEAFKHYVDAFNRNDDVQMPGQIPNAAAWDWVEANVPFFKSSDKSIEETYSFRWWTCRKHIKPTPDGFVIDEFLPNVSWASKYDTISCAAGHHFYEGRWLLRYNGRRGSLEQIALAVHLGEDLGFQPR